MPEEETGQRVGLSGNRRVLAMREHERRNRLAEKQDAPTKERGHALPPSIQAGKLPGPNESKLSDGGRKNKELGTDAPPPFAGARG